MKILVCHNHYQQPGGEDRVFADEVALLECHGHQVLRFEVHNDSIEGRSKLGVARETIWNRSAAADLGRLVRSEGVRLVHFHNTFPLISPAAYWSVGRAGAAVVQTLHNYRLLCPGAALVRRGRVCESCVGKRLPWPAVLHGCYRQSRLATATVAAMLSVHRALGTYSGAVDRYIALTEFARSTMVRSGLPEDKVYVKPNFVPDPLPGLGALPERTGQVVFVGRLTWEKGVDLLLEAWGRIPIASGRRLVIVGDGPERAELERRYGNLPGVVWRGWLERKQLLREVAASRFLVMPSRWYEGFPMVLVESLSLGTPVIAPNHAGFPEIISPGSTGALFSPGDDVSFTESLDGALRLDEGSWRQWSRKARDTYLERYTPEANYPLLEAIYEKDIGNAKDREQV